MVSVMDAAGNERETAILINAENPDEEQEDDGDLELVPARDVFIDVCFTQCVRGGWVGSGWLPKLWKVSSRL